MSSKVDLILATDWTKRLQTGEHIIECSVVPTTGDLKIHSSDGVILIPKENVCELGKWIVEMYGRKSRLKKHQ